MRAFLLLATLVVFAGCRPDPVVRARENLAKADAEPVVGGSNVLGFRLLQFLSNEEPEANLFLSPSSIHLALTMTYNGSAGQTKEEMAKTLGLAGLALEAVNASSRSVQHLLSREQPGVRLACANSLWVDAGYPVEPEFVRTCREFFAAQVEEADLQDPATVKRVNEWVSKHTMQRIPKIVDRFVPLARLVLLNAIYFKGDWKTKFDKRQTYPGEFRLSSGKTVRVDMMNMSRRKQLIGSTDLADMLKLPYKDEKLAMVIMLPKENSSVAEVVEALAEGAWNDWRTKFSLQEIDITIPKFRLEYEVLLNDPLQSLGMVSAFRGDADFSKMTAGGVRNLFISRVIHKAFVEVNEEGTEAAAATMVEMAELAFSEFRVDRPFVFLIVDDACGLVLFAGVLNDPRP